MGTVVTIEVAHPDAPGPEADEAISAAFKWFHDIEAQCSRFSPESELSQLVAQPGIPFAVSPALFEALRFALTVAEASGGAFDPTTHSAAWRDIELDPEHRTVTLHRPLTLDLGAVAKGLAVDTAARQLRSFEDFAIDAGGDLYLSGRNPHGAPWSVGIRHPRRERELVRTLRLSNQAVCTSGDYERGRHILDPRTGQPADRVASVTVIAPSAMLADALATAAFVLGPERGIEFLNRMGVEGVLFTPDLHCLETGGMSRVA
jgi:thiamine biosynthesis lipoprotein